jgi:tetratricopeptide (TPR) repeat protein
MEAFAKREWDAGNPKTRFLAGYVDLDKADVLRRDGKYENALTAAERACALGEHWPFLQGRARIHVWQDEPELALPDLDRALELRPGLPELLFERARALDQLERWEDAGRSLLDGLRADPSDGVARGIFDHVLQGLVYEGWRLGEEGQHEAALRVLDLAAQLAPGNAEVQSQRASIVSPPGPRQAGPADDLAELEERVRADPDDFRAHQRLDYALARRGEFDRVVELWSEFLSRNPGHGQAHLERGGAYFHSGNRELALADARAACELGVNEGCLRVRQLSVGQ